MKGKIWIPLLVVVVAAGVVFALRQQEETPAVTAQAPPASPPEPASTSAPATEAPPAEAPAPSPSSTNPPADPVAKTPSASKTPVAPQPAPESAPAETHSSPSFQSTGAPIVLEVFSDHQCPACRRFYLEVARNVLADYGTRGKVLVVYHEFPLEKLHAYSRQAARFTQAAARVSPQTWLRVTDALYYYQPQWSANGQVEAVVRGALSPAEWTQVRQWLDDPSLDAHIERDLALGRQRDVRSTPTVFLTIGDRTERVPPGVDYPILRRYLDNVLAQLQQ